MEKYSGKGQAIKTSEFWNSIPQQLARENKKFKYKFINLPLYAIGLLDRAIRINNKEASPR